MCREKSCCGGQEDGGGVIGAYGEGWRRDGDCAVYFIPLSSLEIATIFYFPSSVAGTVPNLDRIPHRDHSRGMEQPRQV